MTRKDCYCKFSLTREYFNSTVQHKAIRSWNSNFSFYCTSALLSLFNSLMFHFIFLLISINWTPLYKDQEVTTIIYLTCILRWVLYLLCGAYYSWNMLVVEKIDQKRTNCYNILSTICIEFHLYFSCLWFHNTLKILDNALWLLKLHICRYVTV